jgi:hypothetical protein
MKFVVFLVLSLCLFSSCRVKTGSGNIVSVNRSESGFHGVNAGGNFKVHLKQGPDYKVTLRADDNIIEDIETDVRNGKLYVNYENNVSLRNVTMEVFVESPALRYISASAGAVIDGEGLIKEDNKIEVHGSSAGKVTVNVDAPNVDAHASSGSNLHLLGRTKNVDAQSSSGASLDADELLAENVKADASSGASIQVYGSVKVNAEASSGASVNYRGSGTVTSKASSGGNVRKID